MKTITTTKEVQNLFIRIEKDSKPIVAISGIQKIEYHEKDKSIIYYDSIGNLSFIHYIKEVKEEWGNDTSKLIKVILD